MSYKLLNHTPSLWNITYNPYSDVVKVYLDSVMHTQRSYFTIIHEGKDIIYKDKDSDGAVLIEVHNAYDKLGDIDNMDKTAIIKKIERYMSHYGTN